MDGSHWIKTDLHIGLGLILEVGRDCLPEKKGRWHVESTAVLHLGHGRVHVVAYVAMLRRVIFWCLLDPS